MSFQIRSILLYGPDEAPRVLALRPGRVNVITGASRTGKSALTSIVEYCFGGKCKVPKGPIRRTVEWYGILLEVGEHEVLVVRRAPPRGGAESGDAYVEVGADIAPPAKSAIRANVFSADRLEEFLSQQLGIRDQMVEPPPGQTRSPFAIQVRHSLFFCFQDQEDIISKERLFHRQGEPFLHQAIKDTLPYFLGATDEQRVLHQRRLRDLRQDLRRAERQLAEDEAIRGSGHGRALNLLREASDLGLPAAPVSSASWDEAVESLRVLLRERPVEPEGDDSEGGREYGRLMDERQTLTAELRRAEGDLASAEQLARAEQGFEEEAAFQASRLATVGFFGKPAEHASCPLCRAPVEDLPTKERIEAARQSLVASVEEARHGVPHLERLTAELGGRVAEAKRRLADNKAALTAIATERDRIVAVRELGARQAHVLGRISLYLESLPQVSGPSTALADHVASLRREIASLEAALGTDTTEERLASAVSRVSWRLTTWAGRLGVEHSNSPVRFDPKRLTLIADADEPIPMNEMGSGSNFAGYHVAFHLALHRQFAEDARPVPRFLFLDQPSEVYFPADRDARDLEGGKDEEREAVVAMFDLIWEAVAELGGTFQVVLTEHADLDEPWYQEAVVERWRGGEALIPAAWLRSGEPDGEETEGT